MERLRRDYQATFPLHYANFILTATVGAKQEWSIQPGHWQVEEVW